MHRREAYLLLILFPLTATILYRSIQLPKSQNPNQIPFHQPNPNQIPFHQPNPNHLPHRNFSFTIKVLAFNRIESLRRCLRSLAAADYAGDRVNLHLLIDHIDAINGSDEKLKESHRILELIDGFEWVQGEKIVHYRVGNVGLQAQWVEAWWPVSDDDFVFVVEDDLEVSPMYYEYLKGLIFRYYYDLSNYSPLIYGVSLQRPRFVAGKHGNKLQIDRETRLFLYQIVGTWGQLLFPKPWKQFRLWYDAHKAKGFKPILQGMVTTSWYKKMGERIWTPWFIKFIHSNGYYNIYTNFLNERALAISHRDAGVNYGKTAGPDSKLLLEKPLEFDIWEMKPLKKLKWYDFCFREVQPWRFVRRKDELESVLGSMQKQKPVVIVSIFRISNKLSKNLLCHLEKINTRNVIFIGGTSELTHDLAQRGYPVIDSEKLINSYGSYKLIRSDRSRTDIMDILAISIAVKKSIELGHASWVIEGNIIPLSNFFSELPDPSCPCFSFAKDLEMVFVRNSQLCLKIWDDDFISKLVKDSSLESVNYKHFAYFAKKALEESGVSGVCSLYESKIGVEVGTNMPNKTSLNDSKMVFWSRNMDLNSTQRWLNHMELWLIDEDLSCVSFT